MPNWTTNILCVEGNTNDVQDFTNKIKATTHEQEYTILSNIVPMPPTEDEDNWYEWNTTNWGTKWQDCDTILVSSGDNSATFRFDTAWSPPVEGIAKVSKAFPNLTFILSYQEMGMGYVGSAGYKDGLLSECSSENITCEREEDELDMDKVFGAYEYAQIICEFGVRNEVFLLTSTPSPSAQYSNN